MSAQRRSTQTDIPAWEWAVAGFGLFIFLGAIGFFTVRSFADRQPPDFRLQVDSLRAGAVSFTIRNLGDVTAADVVIGAAQNPAGATVRFDFLPARSQRSGVLFLKAARLEDVALQVQSYVVP